MEGAYDLRTIIALDSLKSNKDKITSLVEKTCGLVAGYKLGWPNLIGALPQDIVEAVKRPCPEKLLVVDLKLADIYYTMRTILDEFPDSIDAVIAHAFVGRRNALEELKNYLDMRDIRLVLVASMSHPGSKDVIDPCMGKILETIRQIKPWGVVAPATRSENIRIMRRELGPEMKILSPGIGAQGAEPGDALRAGADYEIIGRMVTTSPDPLQVLNKIIARHKSILNKY